MLSRLYPEIPLVGVATRRSALRDCPALTRVITAADELGELVTELREAERLHVLLVDDADVVDDPTRALSDLFAAPRANLHAIVAGRTDALKTLGHWSVGVRRARTGLLLQPDVQIDGPLLGVTLPAPADAAGPPGLRLPRRPRRVRARPGRRPGRRRPELSHCVCGRSPM